MAASMKQVLLVAAPRAFTARYRIVLRPSPCLSASPPIQAALVIPLDSSRLSASLPFAELGQCPIMNGLTHTTGSSALLLPTS